MLQFFDFTDIQGKRNVLNASQIVKLSADGSGPWDIIVSTGERISVDEPTALGILKRFGSLQLMAVPPREE